MTATLIGLALSEQHHELRSPATSPKLLLPSTIPFTVICMLEKSLNSVYGIPSFLQYVTRSTSVSCLLLMLILTERTCSGLGKHQISFPRC